VTPGNYVLEIRHPNKLYEPLVEEVTVQQGETVTLAKELEVRNPFNTKAIVRLLLGAGAIAGFVWGIIEQSQYSTAVQQAEQAAPAEAAQLREESHTASSLRTLAIVLGSACTLGFEIVAFF
jgi:hypothetical protein